MTERYGYRDEPGGGQRPSGRGAVAERRAGQEEEVREVDLTDEAADREQAIADAEQPPDQRQPSDSFEPHPVAGAPAASTSIFDVGREEETASGPPESATGEGELEAAEREAERERAEAEATEPAAAEPGAAEAPAAGEPATPEPAAPVAAAAPPEGLLVGSLDAEGARNRFLDIQAGFVDEPRQAVEEAGRFVDELVQRITDALRAQRSQLQAADDASTEDLRLTLRAYRQFVDRLLGLAR